MAGHACSGRLPPGAVHESVDLGLGLDLALVQLLLLLVLGRHDRCLLLVLLQESCICALIVCQLGILHLCSSSAASTRKAGKARRGHTGAVEADWRIDAA